jgi:hypothetical protein
MNHELDELLSRPLAEVPDQGFSARVLTIIARRQMIVARIDAASWIALALVAAAALSLSAVGRALAALALSLNGLTELSLALTVILLLFALREQVE